MDLHCTSLYPVKLEVCRVLMFLKRMCSINEMQSFHKISQTGTILGGKNWYYNLCVKVEKNDSNFYHKLKFTKDKKNECHYKATYSLGISVLLCTTRY